MVAKRFPNPVTGCLFIERRASRDPLFCLSAARGCGLEMFEGLGRAPLKDKRGCGVLLAINSQLLRSCPRPPDRSLNSPLSITWHNSRTNIGLPAATAKLRWADA